MLEIGFFWVFFVENTPCVFFCYFAAIALFSNLVVNLEENFVKCKERVVGASLTDYWVLYIFVSIQDWSFPPFFVFQTIEQELFADFPTPSVEIISATSQRLKLVKTERCVTLVIICATQLVTDYPLVKLVKMALSVHPGKVFAELVATDDPVVKLA